MQSSKEKLELWIKEANIILIKDDKTKHMVNKYNLNIDYYYIRNYYLILYLCYCYLNLDYIFQNYNKN